MTLENVTRFLTEALKTPYCFGEIIVRHPSGVLCCTIGDDGVSRVEAYSRSADFTELCTRYGFPSETDPGGE